MADLARLESGVNAPAYQTKPLNLGQEPPQALPPNTAALSKANAHAALMGTVAQTLSNLPNLILGNFVKGRQLGTQLATDKALAGVLSGNPPKLPEGASIGPGGITYHVPDATSAELSKLRLEETKSDIALKDAKLEALKSGGAGMQDNPLSSAFGGITPAAPEPATPSGGILGTSEEEKPIGTATSYGYTGDHYGGPKATASLIGPLGNKLDSDSLAVSPDVEKMLVEKGYKFGDQVTLQTAGGGQVTRRWDDRTAQHDPTGQFSVDDKGRQIIGENGKPLPALFGRFDFHAGADNKPSKYNGIQITGIAPKPTPGALGATEPPLPTGGAGALASEGQANPALASDGMPVPVDAETSQAAQAMGPDGTIDEQAAINATGGKKLTEQGHAGGVVTRFAGFDKEETPDGTVYVYPHKIKPGQKPFTVFKKPVQYHADTVKLMSAAGYQPKPGETEASVAANARAALTEAERVPPDARPVFMRWGSSLQSNPVVKEFYTARHQRDVVEAALSKGLTPAAALGVIDAYVKAMRGGAATQGMTRILEEAQPLVQQMKLRWQKLTGGPGENAVLTKEMAEDVRHILTRIEEASRHEVEGMKEGDKEYLSTIGIPSGAVEKTYKRILTGAKSSIDSIGEVPAGEAAPAGDPSSIQSKKAELLKTVLAKYQAGVYTGEEKTRAEAMLKANGALP